MFAHENVYSKLKGRPELLLESGLTAHYEIIAALPNLFNFQDHRQLSKIKFYSKYIDDVIKHSLQSFTKIHKTLSKNQVCKLLRPSWPLLLRNAEPTKFLQHLKYIHNQLSIAAQDICFMWYYGQKFPQKYPQFCLKTTLEYFKVPRQKIELKKLVNVIIGQECIESLLLIKKLNLTAQVQKYRDNQQNASSMTEIFQSILKSRRIIQQLIKNCSQSEELALINNLDEWMKLGGNCQCLDIFRVLKIILLFESLFEYKSKDESTAGRAHHYAISIIIKQSSRRLLNRLFTDNGKQKILILDWILNSEIWSSSKYEGEQLKKILPPYLTICYQFLTLNKPKNLYIMKMQQGNKELIMIYLNRIKQKYYISGNSFNSKLPRYFREINLSFVQFSQIKQESYAGGNSLNKNTSGTVSMTKISQNIALNKETDIEQYMKIDEKQPYPLLKPSPNAHFNKLIGYLTNETENLNMHNVYILCLLIQNELTKSNEDNSNLQLRRVSVTKIFYRVMKSIEKYEQVFCKNKLIWEINKIISKFTVIFTFSKDNSQQFCKPELPDLQLIHNDHLNIQRLSKYLLKSPIYFSLSTLYQIQYAQNHYNEQSFKQMNENTKGKNKAKLDPVSQNYKFKHLQKLIPEKEKEKEERTMFVNCLYMMVNVLTTQRMEIKFIGQLLLIRDHRISQILYLNLIFYLLVKNSKQSNDKELNKRVNELDKIMKMLLPHYFLLDKPRKEELAIIYILATAYKLLENWNYTTRRSFTIKPINKSPYIYGLFDQQKSIAQIYWQILLSSTDLSNTYKYSQQFEKVNCIKESIYLMQLYSRRNFPTTYTEEEAKYMYSLCSRLDNNLEICKSYVEDKLAENTFGDNNFISSNPFITGESCRQAIVRRFDQGNRKSKWYPVLKYIRNNRTIENFTSIVYLNTIRICELEDAQEINEILNEISLFSVYYEVLNSENYQKLHNKMLKVNKKDICLTIARSLYQIKSQESSRLSSLKQSDKEQKEYSQKVITKLLYIIFHEKLRFSQYYQLQKQLFSINMEDMNWEEIRAAIILCSKIGNYERVRLYYSRLKSSIDQQAVQLKRELLFFNMEACYKSIMYFPAEDMIKNLEDLVKNIIQLPGEKINKKSTNSLFQAIKFICENYLSLTLELEQKILFIFNKYLIRTNEIMNDELSIEAAYFILRFILIESKNTEILLKNQEIFSHMNCKPKILQPHKFLLISNISESKQKNSFIKKILFRIAQNDPILSSWWLYSLMHHCKIESKNHKLDSTDRLIVQMGNSICSQLQRSGLKIKEHLDWIDDLFSATTESQVGPIPSKMVSPFSNEVQLESLVKIENLGQGKSKPVSIHFKAKKNKSQVNIKFIRKVATSNNRSGFRTESATANFFKDSKLLDQGVTYSIIHLCKYCLLIEYIDHKATLDSLMTKNMQNHEIIKLKNVMEAGDFHGRKILGKFYQKLAININYSLYHFFLMSGHDIIKCWWSRYTNFIRTYAQWNYLCYLVGLGDRHSNNILVSEQGKVIHIDFQYIFDSGKMLPYPEWVPFRLTKGLNQQLSIIQPYGLMYSQFIKTAEKFKEKSRQIWHAESHFSFFKNKNISIAINKRVEFKNVFEQSLLLFQKATAKIELRDMFVGWGSHK